jgi:hypothetical protein
MTLKVRDFAVIASSLIVFHERRSSELATHRKMHPLLAIFVCERGDNITFIITWLSVKHQSSVGLPADVCRKPHLFGNRDIKAMVGR